MATAARVLLLAAALLGTWIAGPPAAAQEPPGPARKPVPKEIADLRGKSLPR